MTLSPSQARRLHPIIIDEKDPDRLEIEDINEGKEIVPHFIKKEVMYRRSEDSEDELEYQKKKAA